MPGGIDPGPSLPADVVAHAHSIGPLEAPLIWQSLLGGAVIAAAGIYYFRSRRRLRRRCVVALAVLLLLSGLTGLNTYVGYVRTPHDLARLFNRGPTWSRALAMAVDGDIGNSDDEEVGAAAAQREAQDRFSNARQGNMGLQVRRVSLPDPALKVPVGENNVMLPPGYDDPANAGKRYPVVYLIHGYVPFASPDDWFTAGDALGTMQLLLADHAIPPMIVVGLDMTAGVPSADWECLDVPNGPQLETYLTNWVIPKIDTTFRTVADRSGRSIGGMSAGGYCALNIGLHHLPMFSSILITEPYDDPGDAVKLFKGNRQLIEANTPRDYISTMPFPQQIAVMLDVPTGAPTDVTTGQRIASALLRRGQQAALRKEYGFNHTWHTARAALPFMLAYAAQHFGIPGTAQPVIRPSAARPALADPHMHGGRIPHSNRVLADSRHGVGERHH